MTTLAEKVEKIEQPAWLKELRLAGAENFQKLGFPTTKDEEWRFTSVAPIARTKFVAAPRVDGNSALARHTFGNRATAELVFVNGHFSADLSRVEGLPRGAIVSSLADALKENPDRVRQHLGRYVDLKTDTFVALNSSSLTDGAYVHLARGTAVRGPIHLLFITVPTDETIATHPRVLIVAEENVDVQVVENYVGYSEGVYLTNAVTEIVAGKHSRIDHCKLQHESMAAYHISSTRMELAEQANVISHAASIGAKLSRNDVTAHLNGEYADATLNGLVILNDHQHCDNHTLLRHEKANCPSHELYKYVLSGHSTGVFKGKIFVQKDAQKTNAKQTSKSLLLSDDATMDSMPALEIYADDVKCTHGSTTGPVDEDMVFYLRSRGVSLEAARHLLSYAFAADITRRIKVAPVRERLEDFMAAQHGLPQDLRITDLGEHDEKAR